MNLVGVGVEAKSFPESELVHVGFHVKLQHAVIFDALIEAAPIAESLPVIGAPDLDAMLCKTPAHAARVDLHGHLFWNAASGRAVGDIGLG